MSLFAESSWDTDAVGDKLTKEFSKKKKKKVKKSGKKSQSESGSSVSALPFEEARKNIKAVAKSVGASKSTKLKVKKRKRSDSQAPEESLPKKLKKANPGKNTETKNFTKSEKKNKFHTEQSGESKSSFSPVKKSLLSKNEKSVIVKKTHKGAKNVQVKEESLQLESVIKETKSQRRRKKLKLKKSAQILRLNNAKMQKIGTEKSVDKSPTKSLNVQRIEKLLALKEKNVNGKSKIKVKEPESLRDRMMAQLRASRFRFLNETLYNNESSESKKYFKEDPDAFAAYHTGYRQQVEQWPLNPLDVVISSIKKMSKEHIIADFGCGEARLAESVSQKVHSFDLVAVNDNVKACDMAHTPLLTNGVNVVVFCLSLMGTNLADYLLEANRVLKKDGILKIADVESRFESVDDFIQLLENYGFTNTWKDLSHNLFYFMDFKKVSEVNRKTKNLPQIALKPCLYKKR